MIAVAPIAPEGGTVRLRRRLSRGMRAQACFRHLPRPSLMLRASVERVQSPARCNASGTFSHLTVVLVKQRGHGKFSVCIPT